MKCSEGATEGCTNVKAAWALKLGGDKRARGDEDGSMMHATDAIALTLPALLVTSLTAFGLEF
eukprot:6261305-Amphidinium_carterae.1